MLRNHLKQSMGFETNMEGGFLARRRHLQALAEAAEHLEQGKAQLLGAWAGELLAEELRLAQQNLSEITGEFTSDDLLGRIFSSFCIGKYRSVARWCDAYRAYSTRKSDKAKRLSGYK